MFEKGLKKNKIAEVVLTDVAHDLSVISWQETGDKNYNFLQIFTPPHRKCMAIEPEKKCTIKVVVSEDDHDTIRLAAALQRKSMTDFCRDIAMAEARKVTKDIQLSPIGKVKKRT